MIAGVPGEVGAVAYLAVLALLVPFGLHRLLLLLRLSSSAARPGPTAETGPVPAVTVQIPVYNEANVVARAVDAACRLEHPRDRLEIQVLDDSTDETSRIAAERVAAWRARGVEVRHLRRDDRDGYKAGALRRGVREARGELFLILDADFVPPPDLLRRLLPEFRNPDVGFVQAAWDHLNDGQSWLTRAQALLLDAHFSIGHEARHRAGLYFNFNGTAGMWRRDCLEEAGGWRSDTLTEDLDLSYRAQLAGWRGVYRDDVRVPAELPTTLGGLERQQRRWTRGGVETARRLLPRIWRSDARLAVRLEATAHLAGHLTHPLTLLLGALLAWPGRLGGAGALVPGWVHVAALGAAVLPFLAYYGAAARRRGYSILATLRRVPEALALAIGLGPALTGAVARGIVSSGGAEFERTPKRGDRTFQRYGAEESEAMTAVRCGLGSILGWTALRLLAAGEPAGAIFTGLFAAGHLGTAAATLLTGERPSPPARSDAEVIAPPSTGSASPRGREARGAAGG